MDSVVVSGNVAGTTGVTDAGGGIGGTGTGGSLTVSWAPGEPIRMRGTTTHVFSGELDLEALQ